MVTEARLRRWYSKFNRQYFASALPNLEEVKLRFAPLGDELGEAVVFGFIRAGIITLPTRIRWSDTLVKQSLLHEMAHLKLGPDEDHGPAFRREMRRLMLAGAFDGIL